MASTSDSRLTENASDSPQQALLEVSQDGTIVWADAEAAGWWGTTTAPLPGRALTGLFVESRNGAATAAWTTLLDQTRGAGAQLTAAAPGGSFGVFVQVTPKGEPDATGRDTFIVSVERGATPPPPPTPAARPRPAVKPLDVEPAGPDDALDAELPEDDDDALTALDDTPSELETAEEDDSTEALELPDLDALAGAPTIESSRIVRRTAEPSGGFADAPAAPLEARFAAARLGFFHIDLASGAARFSDAWKALLGYEPDDVPDEADALATLVHPDDSEASPLALQHDGPFSAEVRLRTKEDAWRWMQLEGVCTAGDDGKPARVDGVMLDAQERREAEEEAARNEERFLRLTGRGSAGFFEIDLARDEAWFSPEFRRALGRRADELGATPDGLLAVLPPEDAQVGLAAFFQSVSRGLPALVTRYQLMHADGRAIDLDVFLAVRRSRRGVIEHVSALQATARDEAAASEPAAAAPARAATSGLADAVSQALDAALEPIILVDPNGLILHVNARAAALAGAEPDRLATRSFHEVFNLVLRATGAPASQLLESALRGTQPLELDQSCQLMLKGGPEDVALSCRPVLDEQRRLTSTTVVLRRLAEMPLTQAELVKSNRMEALGRLACGIVHDFNNLLTTVVGGVSLALDKRDLSPLETALKACTNAKNLARQLLTFARGDVTGRRVQSLNDIIRETARMAGAGSKTTVALELSPDLHPVNVVTSQLVQVFTNLILNAMQVMPQGGHIVVRTFNMPLGQVNSVNLPAGEYVRADVQDNGPGIPPENLARIFEPFFTTRAEGTGLGLAMVNSIVAQHEGAIEASSTVGAGTTFTLYFPRAHTEVVQEVPQKLSVSYGTGRILVMDDDPDLCAIASGMLEMLGYQAETATTADETIAKVQKSRDMGRLYSAVILDLTMAGGPGGEEVVGRLREIAPEVRAIVSSGYATDENADHYRKLGFVATLSKPYRSGDLGRVLREVLGPPPKGVA
ncbi:MAG: PAS domain-containing protein [Opitutaceae bacterium]|nr:PAS domain-containing protein [Opitutaceae bacterium]